MKLTERQLNEIVQEEIYIYLIDKLLSEARYDPSVQWKPFKTREEWARDVLKRRDAAKASGIPADRPNAADQFEAEKLREWHWMWSSFYFYKSNYGYFFAIRKNFGKLLRSFIKYIFFTLTFNKKLNNKYKSRFLGLLNAMLGKKSLYRVNSKFQ